MDILINPHLTEKENFQALTNELIGESEYTIGDVVAVVKEGYNTKTRLTSGGKDYTIYWNRLTPERKQLLVLDLKEETVKESLIGSAIVPSPYDIRIDEEAMTVELDYHPNNLLYTGVSVFPLVLINVKNAEEGLYKPDAEDDFLKAYVEGRDGAYSGEEVRGDDDEDNEDYLAAYLSGRDGTEGQ